MAQETFENGETYGVARDVINGNALDAETRLTALESFNRVLIVNPLQVVNIDNPLAGWKIHVLTYNGRRLANFPPNPTPLSVITIVDGGPSGRPVDCFPGAGDTIDGTVRYRVRGDDAATFIYVQGDWKPLVDTARRRFLVDAMVVPPVYDWTGATSLPASSVVDVAPVGFGTGDVQKLIEFDIIAGSLPDGLTLDDDPESPTWSNIVGTTTGAASGSCTIRSSNPAGWYDYVLVWNVS